MGVDCVLAWSLYFSFWLFLFREDKDNVFASYELWTDFNISLFNFFLLWTSFYSVYFLTFLSNVCILNIGLEDFMLFISGDKDFSRTSNLVAVNLVLSWFLRSRRTCLSVLNTSVKSWYYKSFSKILMNLLSKSAPFSGIDEKTSKWHKPVELDLIFGYGQFWLQPQKACLYPRRHTLLLCAQGCCHLTGGGDGNGDKEVSLKLRCLSHLYVLLPSPYLQSLAPRPLFPPPSTCLWNFSSLVQSRPWPSFKPKAAGVLVGTQFFFLSPAQNHICLALGFIPLQEWLKIWFGLELRVSFSRKGKETT